MSVARIAAHVRRFLLLYSVLALLAGLALGYAHQGFIKEHQLLMRDLIIALAIATIYPSMVQLRVERLGGAARKVRHILLAMFFIFVVAPVIALGFACLFEERQVAMGYIVSNVVPASSASIGYVLIAEGDIELATILAVLSLIGAFGAVPGYLRLYAGMTAVPIPLLKILKSLVYTLLTPFILGQVTRYLLIIRRARREAAAKGIHKELVIRRLDKAMKPALSLATMLSMLALIAMLIANKADKLVTHPVLALKILGLQTTMLGVLLALITGLDRLFRVYYEEHAAIAFISATKNQSVAAAIAIMALGPEAAIVPALVPVIQAPVAIAYLHLLPQLARYFPRYEVPPSR